MINVAKRELVNLKTYGSFYVHSFYKGNALGTITYSRTLQVSGGFINAATDLIRQAAPCQLGGVALNAHYITPKLYYPRRESTALMDPKNCGAGGEISREK